MMKYEKYLSDELYKNFNKLETLISNKELFAKIKSSFIEGPPTGVGFCDELGYFILQTSGQGPYLVWSEKKFLFTR